MLIGFPRLKLYIPSAKNLDDTAVIISPLIVYCTTGASRFILTLEYFLSVRAISVITPVTDIPDFLL